jgi:hypothetical protein
MIKRALCTVILVALAVSFAGPTTAPVTAAPSAAVADHPNARLLPADTALYVDIRSADLTKTVDFALDMIEKVTGARPANIYADMNRQLTQVLGREASFEKDVLSWLGDHITVGLPVTDEQLKAMEASPMGMNNLFANPDLIVIFSVKNDAAAANFFKELLDKAAKNVPFSTRTQNVAGVSATIYDQSGMCETLCYSFALAKGYIVATKTLLLNPWVEAFNAKKPMLADDTGFAKVINALKPNNLFTVYLSPRYYQTQLATMQGMMTRTGGAATPEVGAEAATNLMKTALSAIEGQAFAFRREGKVLALDIAQSVNLKAMAEVYQEFGLTEQAATAMMPKAIDAKLAGQIPSKALFALVGGGLSGLYDGLKAGLAAMSSFSKQLDRRSQQQFEQIEMGLRQFEAYLKLGFDLDLRQDILSWMTGEFALYALYNPNSDLMKTGNGDTPFDPVLLIETGDAAKTRSFLTKLNAGLEKNAKLTAESVADDVYSLDTQNGVTLGYGLVGGTFLLTTGSGLDATRAAIKGDGVLSSSRAWKNAQASMVKPASQILFVNLSELVTVLKPMMPSGTRRSDQQALTLLEQFESASFSAGVFQPNGLSLASVQFIMK